MIIRYEREDELCHFGIPGMHWHRRRFQNEDGSYTAAGRARYGIGQAKKALATAGVVAGINAGVAGRKVYEGVNKAAAKARYGANAVREAAPGAAKVAKEVGKRAALETLDAAIYPAKIAGVVGGTIAKESAKAVGDMGAYTAYMAANLANPYVWRRKNLELNDDGSVPRNKLEEYSNLVRRTKEDYQRLGAAAKDKFGPGLSIAADNAMGAAKRFGNGAKEGLTGAAASALAAKNGLQYRAQEAADNARKGAGAFGEIMKAYGKEIGGNANSAVARYLDAANKRAMSDGSSAPSARGRADNAADEAAAAFRNRAGDALRNGMTTAALYANGAKNLAGNYARYAKDAIGNSNAVQTGKVIGMAGKQIAGMTGRDFMNLANRRGTGDPGEDRDKLDPNARSGYDKRISNAIGWANGRRQAAANAEADAAAKREENLRAGVRADIAKYQKQMMDDYRAMGNMSRGDSVKASQYMERSGYGGNTPFTLEFGNEKVTSNPVKALREFNNPSTPNLRNVTGSALHETASDKFRSSHPNDPNAYRLKFADQTYAFKPNASRQSGAQGSKDDRMLAYQEGVNSILGRSGESSAFQRMKNLESQMNAYRDNQARAKAESSSDPRIKALLSSNNQVQGEHTRYFGRNLRQLNEAHNRENWNWDQGEKRANTWQRDYNKAEQFAKEHTPSHLREIGHIDQGLLRAKMSEIQSERDDYERKNTKIPDWIKRDYGTSKADIPDYLWEELKKRR